MVDWHAVEFGIPKLRSLTDDQLEALFMDRDGRWSSTVKDAMRRFGTDKLDLDENWASRWPNWECPGCGRQKRDILRVSNAGVLLARLDLHHDHLTDLFKGILHAKLGPRWRDVLPPNVGHLEELVSATVARFAASAVCSDCNNADAVAKARASEIPRSFSFRPSEIRGFITAQSNAEHIIDVGSARSIYRSVSTDFELRVTLVETLADMALRGGLAREPGNLPNPLTGDRLSPLRYIYDWVLRDDIQRHNEICSDLQAFKARSVSRDGISTGKRKKSQEPAQPTEAEVAVYDGGGAPDLWRAAPGDWRCPACGRDRGEILRRSNNRNRIWAGKLVRHTEFLVAEALPGDEDDKLSVAPRIDRHELHLICLDCSTILPGVKSRYPDISVSAAIFQFSDMRAVAIAAPNRGHSVDWLGAAERARASLPLAELVREYWTHHNQARECRALYRSALANCGGNKARAWASLTGLYATELAELEDPEGWLDYLLTEADRICIEDPFRVPAGAVATTKVPIAV